MSLEGQARPAQLAERIGVSRFSASRVVNSLKKKSLLTHKPYKTNRLTDAGKQDTQSGYCSPGRVLDDKKGLGKPSQKLA